MIFNAGGRLFLARELEEMPLSKFRNTIVCFITERERETEREKLVGGGEGDFHITYISVIVGI
jgi:hypothetical protein